nr:MAG TPA_asm: hypothetical protein [Caudoviricetes sp.]
MFFIYIFILLYFISRAVSRQSYFVILFYVDYT